MKRKFLKSEIVDLIKGLDVRARDLTPAQIDTVIDMGFAEMATIQHLFTNEEIIDLSEWQDSNETNFTVDIEEDVVSIYELYVTSEGKDPDEFDHGIKEMSDSDLVWKDNRYQGRVHVNLDRATDTADNLVIKYFFTPKSTDDEYFMDQPTYLASFNAFSTALYDRLHDVERSMQKLTATARTTMAAIPLDPEDLIEDRDSIFPAGV